MKLSVLCAGPADPHVGWVAIDELATLTARYFDAELLTPRPVAPSWVNRLVRGGRAGFEPVATRGGDVLFVVARGPEDLALIDAVPQARRRFSRIVAWVTDSYHQAGFGRATAQYDAITVTAHEDAALPRQRYGVTAHPLHQGIDTLAWAPQAEHRREIDLIGFGRTPPSYHAAFVERFHRADSPHLYLHSPLGHVTGAQVHAERAMLFKLLQRSSVSLAFHLFVEPQGQRPRSMMVTSRWLESLVSGCIVAGRRPVSRMADEMLGWPGATVELAERPQDAAAQLVELFAQRDALGEQRRRNVREMMQRHDWRDRIARMCGLFGWEQPAALIEDLQRVRERAAAFA